MWDNNTVEDEIQRNSLEYGVSVNTDRSIPDAKSGLKPVARRIIYDAFIEGRTADKPHVKCARIYGDVMGRFHPHGDSSIYGAMIRLSQDWVLRYPLIDVHGNNGNILGDGPAAGRYTEARLSKIAEDGLLHGLKKKNVDFIPNYDETEEEPVTLPAIFPNLLCNPNEGIGWAMGCSWAPHNLVEVKDAILAYLDGNEPMLPGPDFPTGGVVINKNDIPRIMKSGHGTVKIRGKYNVEGNNIVFYELPYGTRLESLMDEIGAACEEGKINGVADIRNETGKKSGLRLTIQVERGANIANVVSQLFAKTELQTSFSYNQIALVGKTPTEFNLKDAIKIYIEHNVDCLTREAKYDLNKIEARITILEGLLKALEDIDNIIKLIKKSESAGAAKQALIDKYGFLEVQAKAILDMKLAKLANLEKIELQNEYADLKQKQEELNSLLNSYQLQIDEVRNRLVNFCNKYGDARRTELTQIAAETKEEKEIVEIPPQECVVIINKNGYIKRVPKTSFKPQKRNGKGVKTAGELVLATISTNTIDSLMVFTNKGKMYRMLVNDIPEATNAAKGQPISSLVKMEDNEEVNLIDSIYHGTDAESIIFFTKKGLIKRSSIEEYRNVKKGHGVAAIKLKEDDDLASVCFAKSDDIMIITKMGKAIRMASNEIKNQGRATTGCKAIKLKDGDEVLCGFCVKPGDKIAAFTVEGCGKFVPETEFSVQERGGTGVSISKSTLVSAFPINEVCDILCMNNTNVICVNSTEIHTYGRTAAGNVIIQNGMTKAIKI